MITEEEILSLKSEQPREVLLMIINDVCQSNDIIGQVVRAHVWIEVLIDGIIFQTHKNPKKFLRNKDFADKPSHLFKLGFIDKNYFEDLKILNKIRNQYVHNIHPHEAALELIEKFSSYNEGKKIFEDGGFPPADLLRKHQELMEKMPYYDEVKNDLNFIENPVPTLIGAVYLD